MSEKSRRAERAEHMKDEAIAIAAQQATAGSGHEPVESLFRHSADEMARAIAAAVAAEREQCARLAEASAATLQDGPARVAAGTLARAIRARGNPPRG